MHVIKRDNVSPNYNNIFAIVWRFEKMQMMLISTLTLEYNTRICVQNVYT